LACDNRPCARRRQAGNEQCPAWGGRLQESRWRSAAASAPAARSGSCWRRTPPGRPWWC